MAGQGGIYARSRLYVTTPSSGSWTGRTARSSRTGRPAGCVDPQRRGPDVFRPGDRAAARARLGLPTRSGHPAVRRQRRARTSPYKDYETVARGGASGGRRATGRPGPRAWRWVTTGRRSALPTASCGPSRTGRTWPRSPPYFEAADLYLHAAKAENLADDHPRGAVDRPAGHRHGRRRHPEEVRSLAGAPGAWSGTPTRSRSATGVRVAAGRRRGHGGRGRGAPRRRRRARRSAPTPPPTLQRVSTWSASSTRTIAWYREIIEDWRDRHRVAPTAGAAPLE